MEVAFYMKCLSALQWKAPPTESTEITPFKKKTNVLLIIYFLAALSWKTLKGSRVRTWGNYDPLRRQPHPPCGVQGPAPALNPEPSGCFGSWFRMSGWNEPFGLFFTSKWRRLSVRETKQKTYRADEVTGGFRSRDGGGSNKPRLTFHPDNRVQRFLDPSLWWSGHCRTGSLNSSTKDFRLKVLGWLTAKTRVALHLRLFLLQFFTSTALQQRNTVRRKTTKWKSRTKSFNI